MTPSSAVIDANVVNGLSAELNGVAHGLSDSPSTFLSLAIARATPICMDEGGLIEAEWRGCCDPDWIENWYVTFASTANVMTIPTVPQPTLIKKLVQDHGFPRSRDRVFIVTSVAAARIWRLSSFDGGS